VDLSSSHKLFFFHLRMMFICLIILRQLITFYRKNTILAAYVIQSFYQYSRLLA